jgi:hypothetical protein
MEPDQTPHVVAGVEFYRRIGIDELPPADASR